MSEKKEGIGELFKTVAWALVIAGAFRTLFFQPFWIPSGSMKDTLLIGDFLFVNKMSYGYSRWSCPFGMCPIGGRILGGDPERGDVVVFRHPVSGTVYVKRLIGLPGDKVQLKDGLLYINGDAAPQRPDGQFIETFDKQGAQQRYPQCSNLVGAGGDCIKERFIETLPGGVEHTVLNATDRNPNDNTGIFHVPEGQFFFMGDNRDNSTDSRVAHDAGGVGYVSEELLLGKASVIVFSSAGKSLLQFWTWRSDRFFKAIH